MVGVLNRAVCNLRTALGARVSEGGDEATISREMASLREALRAHRAENNADLEKLKREALVPAPPSSSGVLSAEEAAERRDREVKRSSRRKIGAKRMISFSSSMGSSSPSPARNVTELCR